MSTTSIRQGQQAQGGVMESLGNKKYFIFCFFGRRGE
jgi:hypothetical protein